MVDDGDEAGSEASHVRGSVKGQDSISMTNPGELMSQVAVGREDFDGVAAGVRDEEMAGVIHIQSRRPREVPNEHLHVPRHEMDLKDTVAVEVGDVEALSCKNKKNSRN